jgi:RNA polymerase sigma-54 factor
LNDDELTEVIQVIQSLSPRPGREYSSTQGEIVIPDLKLYRTKDGFMVELNQDAFPRLTINSAYINMAGDLGSSSQEAKQIKEQLTEAKGLIKSIQSRGETLLRVGKYIVEKQARFFDEGEQAMQPMVLRDVAESLELHESTISRATNQKYMQTPRGTFELKYFFSTGVSQYGSEDQSAIAIKSHIKQLIDDEDPNKPLSDNKLMALLEEKEINVARRTIAKYREAMHIPSSSERKKLNKFK